MSDIKGLLAQYEEINTKLNEQISLNGNKFLESIFQEVFDNHVGLNVVCMVGYTPSFNDGDTCTHSHYTFTGVKSSWGSVDFTDEIGDFEEDFEWDEGDETHLNSSCTTLAEVDKQLANCEEIFERVWDTNYRVVASRGEDGKVTLCVDEYECGY